MDRTQACGVCDASSILAEGTSNNFFIMFQFFKGILGIILIVATGYILYTMAAQSSDDSKKVLRVSADNTTTVVGTVISNTNDCLDSGGAPKCFLKMRITGKDIYVIYNTEGGFCANETAAVSGKNTREGSTVNVYGFYKKDQNNLDTILTCPTQNYSIKVL